MFTVGEFTHHRLDQEDGSKRIWWDRNAAPATALYGVSELEKLEPGATVILAEGETTAEAWKARGFSAVATVCGASTTPTLHALEALRNFDVVLAPDNDHPGRQHMVAIGEVLAAAGTPCRWLELSGLPVGGDIADYSDPDEVIVTLVRAAPPWEPPAGLSPAGFARVASSPLNWREFWSPERKQEDWLLEPLIPRGRSVAIFSGAKRGKSLLLLDVVARLATGQPCLLRPAGEPIHVVYLDFEMTEDDVRERLEDMGYGSTTDLSRLYYYLLPNLAPLDTPSGGQALRAIVDSAAAQLVVIDTTSRVLEGAENDADTLRAFYQHTGAPLKAAGVTVVRLDHEGKDPAKGQRGTSAKADDVDLVWHLSAAGSNVRLRATHRRQNWIPESLELDRRDNPLRHKLKTEAWSREALAVAGQLDRLGVPIEFGRGKAGSSLRADGIRVNTTALTEAIRYRKQARTGPETAKGSSSRTVISDNDGSGVSDRPADRCGQRDADNADRRVSPTGDTLSQSRAANTPSAPKACADCGKPLPGTGARCSDCASEAVANWRARKAPETSS